MRTAAIFAGAVLFCLFAPASIRSFVSSGFDEFRAPMDSIPSHLADLQKYWSLHSNSKRDLIEAGRASTPPTSSNCSKTNRCAGDSTGSSG